MARGGGKAPAQVTWIICLILYIIAVVAAFGIVAVPAPFGLWAWVIGFGLLLLACQVRGL
jgi:hypothetical protein